ncbi:MAG: hydroxyacylglutathione hydrolase [Steroidobacterales bacterium]
MTTRDTPLHVRPVRAFADNYIWLVDSPRQPGRVLAVDPGDAAPVLAELQRSGCSLAAILLTHHHPDHIGGAASLSRGGSVQVIGPDDARIGGLTQRVGDGEWVDLPDLGLKFQALHVPGHTLTHLAFVGAGVVFCGDTLFSAGCGRLFEGTPAQMHASLRRLHNLPPGTRVYCGHEYTASNLRFAAEVEPANAAVAEHRAAVATLRSEGFPTLPSTIALESQINPFLRCEIPSVQAAAMRHAGRPVNDPVETFAVLRAWKDGFR